MYTLGIDIGASSVKLAALDVDGALSFRTRAEHRGSPAACLSALLDELNAALPEDGCSGIAATGSGIEALRESLGASDAARLRVLEEIPACTQGASVLAPQARSIVQMGAQSSCYIAGFAEGAAPQFAMNDGCAAGTGSFFEDQMGRLGLPLEDYSRLVAGARSVPRLSGRCSVFAKTDIIHRQQEGVPVEDILLGLCFAVVKSFKATIVGGLPVERPMALAGGVALNEGVVRAVREVFGLEEGELLASPELVYLQAAGAAREAAGAEGALSLEELRGSLGDAQANDGLPRLAALPQVPLEAGEGFSVLSQPWQVAADGRTACALGVDAGSTSTNLVLVDARGKLLDAQYLRTRGNPKQAVRDGLASLERRVGDAVRVVAVGVTGSGRAMIGKMVGADAVRDEITAQARAAVEADPLVDTVFEIGGQDSKYVGLKRGQVADFQMNKVCAAGTGSFVEEQAVRLGIPLDEYGALALSSTAPVDLGERCTVFMETAMNAALAKGAAKADVAAGLCLSVVRNYLSKVVAGKPVGPRVVLQGGVAYNPAIVAAFKASWGDALTVSPWFAVSGAVGAALLALEGQREASGSSGAGEAADFKPTAFRGFDLAGSQARSTHGHEEDAAANRCFFRRLDDLFLEGYDPVRDPDKKTVGVPRCLMLHKLFPMANAFFKELGYNVVLTDASDENTVRLAQQYAQGETCYPVKLVYGHMAQLLDAGVDYVFMPSVHTIRHVKSVVPNNYACPYMQMAPQLIATELGYAERGVQLLSPQLSMDFGQAALAEAMLGVGVGLGHTPEESARAMLAGGFAVMEFTRKTEALGDELLASLKPGERVMVLITRNYGIVDPALNMGIPDLLLDRGQKVITVSHLHAHDLDIAADYPGMYWPFGQHIISGAKLVRRDPRLFAVYLTNHGCGPDTMVSHLFAQEMGDKPYLHIEMDEHYSKVGVITRIEAFLNAVAHYEAPDERLVPTSCEVVNTACEPLDASVPAVLPSVGPYGPLVAAWLCSKGMHARAVPPGPESLAHGKDETTSKEYYTFTSILGWSLEAAGAAGKGAGGAAGAVQLLLPSSEGGDADGQYDRVVHALLAAKGCRDARVVAPSFERLPCAVDDLQGLFTCLLGGDVVQAAPPDARAETLAEILREGVTFEAVCNAARRVAARRDGAASHSGVKRVFVVGEWPLVVGDELVGDAWNRLERAGYRVLRMPFAEYLWFLWEDGRQEAAHEKAVGAPVPLLGETGGSTSVGLVGLGSRDCGGHGCDCGAPACAAASSDFVHAAMNAPTALLPGPAQRPVETDPTLMGDPLLGKLEPALPQRQWRELLDALADRMRTVHGLLGDASAFESDLNELRFEAERVLGSYRGANGRYRAAKERLAGRKADGVVAASSMYENTGIVLKLAEAEDPPAPVLRLSFDGVLDLSIDEKLRSFLYYV